MIYDYHRGLTDQSTGWFEAFGSARPNGLAFTEADRVLGDLEYKRLGPSEFSADTTCADVEKLLNWYGPLFIPCYKVFNARAGHAILLKGVVDKENVILLDPAAKNKKDGGKLKCPLEYVMILLDIDDHPSQTPFVYCGKSTKHLAQVEPLDFSPIDDILRGTDDLVQYLASLAESK